MSGRVLRAGLAMLVLVLGLALLSLVALASQPDAAPEPSTSPNPSDAVADELAAEASPVIFDADALAIDPEDGPTTVTVEAGDIWFEPKEIVLAADGSTDLELVGVGLVAHNLIVDEIGLQLHVGPGISSRATVSDLSPGTYQFYCSIYGHRRAGMWGTLMVE